MRLCYDMRNYLAVCDRCVVVVFFFNDTATTEIYTLSLHDALPISPLPTWSPRRSTGRRRGAAGRPARRRRSARRRAAARDRKSTRLNSSHANISYAVFCLKKKKTRTDNVHYTLYSNFLTSQAQSPH